MLADAWFDVCTSAPGLGHALAVAEAVCVEIPLAGAAFWLALTLTRYTGPAARSAASFRARRGLCSVNAAATALYEHSSVPDG
jgi:hypothetical protein